MKNKHKEDILPLLKSKEGVEVEFKSARGGFPNSFWETFSAFANTNGGVIVLGISEKEGRLMPDGLTEEQVRRHKKNFWDSAHNKGKVSATMLAEGDVTEIEVDEGKVIVFHIPRASYDIRPVYLNNNPLENTYKRNHEGDYHCTEVEVRQMFSDAHHATLPFDNQILTNFSMDDIDIPTLRGYRQRFMLKKEKHPWNELDDFAFLCKLGAYRINRETGEEGFTRAGILMFGKGNSITDESCAPWYFVDYQEKMSDDPIQRWSDRIYPDGTWESNLYQYFFRVYNKLSQSLPTPFQLEGGTRIEETTGQIAIREALVNALVHCNYAGQGNIVITREKDKITFRNPGCMLISVEDFYTGNQSLCRNPILQKFFVYLGFGEKAGSGADYILKGCSDNQWNRPEIKESVQPDTVTITFLLNDSKGNVSPVIPSCPKSVLSLSQVCPKLNPSKESYAMGVLTALYIDNTLSMPSLMEKVGRKNRSRFKQDILSPLIEAGLVEWTVKDKPNSSKQAYRLTEKGRALFSQGE